MEESLVFEATVFTAALPVPLEPCAVEVTGLLEGAARLCPDELPELVAGAFATRSGAELLAFRGVEVFALF
jgi:hypothetical protein